MCATSAPRAPLLTMRRPLIARCRRASTSSTPPMAATGTVLLPCGGIGGGPGCYWANPSALAISPAGEVKFVLQGGVQVGSTLVAPYWEQWQGDSGTETNAFQTGGGAGMIFGPAVNGTIGSAVSTAPSTQVTITPTFTNGSIANLPPGSAITIAGTTSSTATAARTPTSAMGKWY